MKKPVKYGSCTPRLLTVFLLLMAVAAGCGNMNLAGVGSGGTGGGGAAKASVAYKASLAASAKNSFLINAILFIDKNNNYRLDQDEQFAVTAPDGTARLEADKEELATCPVVLVALEGVTIESSSMQPVSRNYILSAPIPPVVPDKVNSINPITTQLRELLESGRYSNIQQAMDELAAQLELPPSTNLLAEEPAVGSAPLDAAARSMILLMGLQNDNILSKDKGGETPRVDVERYRAMLRMLKNNMNIISRLNTDENLENLNRAISTMLEAIPRKATEL